MHSRPAITVEQIAERSARHWLRATDGTFVRGVTTNAGSNTIMCCPTASGDYRWWINRIPASERAVRALLEHGRLPGFPQGLGAQEN